MCAAPTGATAAVSALVARVDDFESDLAAQVPAPRLEACLHRGRAIAEILTALEVDDEICAAADPTRHVPMSECNWSTTD